MKIAVAVKIVPDSQDVAVGGNGEMDVSKARPVVSEYDLPAIEAAARVAKGSPESEVVAITAGPASIDDSKVKKNVLARGADELEMKADDSLSGLDAFATAEVLAGVIEGLGDIDLVVCGDGSADEYAQQVDVQLAERLGMPIATSVVGLSIQDGIATAARALEDCVETVELGLPAVVSVTDQINEPRYPAFAAMKAARKKPLDQWGIDDLVEVPGGEALVMRRALTSVTFSEENVRDGSGTIIQDAGEGGRALADYILSVVK